ncbi:MAG: XdhC family protein [Thiolinea sp.]
MQWLTQLARRLEAGEAVVLLTVLDTRGSVPRERGTKMLVTAEHSYGTIGGGNLSISACSRHANGWPSLTEPAGGAPPGAFHWEPRWANAVAAWW